VIGYWYCRGIACAACQRRSVEHCAGFRRIDCHVVTRCTAVAARFCIAIVRSDIIAMLCRSLRGRGTAPCVGDVPWATCWQAVAYSLWSVGLGSQLVQFDSCWLRWIHLHLHGVSQWWKVYICKTVAFFAMTIFWAKVFLSVIHHFAISVKFFGCVQTLS